MNKNAKTSAWLIIGGIALVLILAMIAYGTFMRPQMPATTSSQVATTSGGCTFQPTASYSTKDKHSSSIFGGTAYYKANGAPATTTASTDLNKGTEYTYWLSNVTSYVTPLKKVADCGVNTFVAEAYQNASVTLSGYDSVGNTALTTLTASGSNITLGANGQANVKITYQGTAKASAAPFGGLMAVEYNSTISDVTCTGDSIKPLSNNYHLTFTTASISNTFKTFEFDSTLDDGSGNAKIINCQFKNGATAAAASAAYYIRFIPANYYLTNSGDVILDVEQSANQLTTRTGFGTRTLQAWWG